jgi:hypothetical protein
MEYVRDVGGSVASARSGAAAHHGFDGVTDANVRHTAMNRLYRPVRITRLLCERVLPALSSP